MDTQTQTTPEASLRDALADLVRRHGAPIYARVRVDIGYGRGEYVTKSLTTLTAEEAASIVGIEVHVDTRVGR